MLLRLASVTDAGLLQLHGLTNLEGLTIRGTAMTEKGLQQLYDALPDCHIVTDVSVPGPLNIQKIVMRNVDHEQVALAELVAPHQISEVVQLVEVIKKQGTFEVRRAEPLPAAYSLEFRGKSRVLYEARFGDGAFQVSFQRFGVWTKWSISDELKEQLLDFFRE
jgi:hypothetical protein